MESNEPDGPGVSQAMRRRASVAGLVGGVIEYYDFNAYAFLAVVIAPQFFPADNSTASLLATLAVFGAGYLAKPLGGAFFGRLGDRRGRKDAMLLTVLMMGVATALMGLLPVYETAGLLSPALLVIVRLAQGFAAGGEVMGAATYLGEMAEDNRRGRMISRGSLGIGIGAALAPLVVGVVTLLVGADAMSAWGWRMPFLAAIPLFMCSLVLRMRLEDSAEFTVLVNSDRRQKTLVWRIFTEFRRPLLQSFVLATAAGIPPYFVIVYMNIYLSESLGVERQAVYWLSAFVLLFALPGYTLGGWAADRFGVARSVAGALLACGLIVYPAMLLMGVGGNIAVMALMYLVIAALSNVVTATIQPVLVNLFPTAVRYSGTSLGWNFAAVLVAGATPPLATLLSRATGSPAAAALLVVAAAVLGLAVLLTVRSHHTHHSEPVPGLDPGRTLDGRAK
ncbi:MFS transporter [Amycolatopsis ultiminotia]